MSGLKEIVYLRKATSDDCDLLFGWANDSLTRNNSFNTEPISYESHVEWYKQILANQSVIQYILELNQNGRITPVGQIRLDIEGSVAEVSYSISKDYRGLGYGKRVLQLVEDEIEKERINIEKLIAKVKPDNTASAKAFLDNDYCNKCLEFEKNLTKNGGGYSS